MILLKPQGAVHQALTLHRFIAWSLKSIFFFLGECRRSSRHFWSRRACLDCGPASKPTIKSLVQYLPVWWGARQIPVIFWLSSSPVAVRRWRVLYFVNVIKISISFPTSVLIISYSVTFCKATTLTKDKKGVLFWKDIHMSVHTFVVLLTFLWALHPFFLL